MATLLELCQDVADDVTLSRPTSVALSTDDTARKLFASAKIAGKDLARSHVWDQLVKEHTFTTVANQTDYSLPSDYDRMVDDTLWDRSNLEEIRGAISPSQWQYMKSSVLAQSATIWKNFRVRSVSGTVQFSIFPTPTAAENLVFEYVSNEWCEDSGGTGQTTFQADTDVPRLDDHLLFLGMRWRFLDRLGFDYAQAKRDYDLELGREKSRNAGGAQKITLAARPLKIKGNIPDSGYGP